MERKLDTSQWLPADILLADVHLLETLYRTLTTVQLTLSVWQLVRKVLHSWLSRSVGDDDGVVPVGRLEVVGGTGHLSLALTE